MNSNKYVNYFTQKELRLRGWTKKLIVDYLFPQSVFLPSKENPEQNIRLFLETTVYTLEKEGSIEKRMEQSLKERVDNKDSKLNKLIQQQKRHEAEQEKIQSINNSFHEFWNSFDARKMKREFHLHIGPTNSGKTYQAVEKLMQAEKGCYLGPLRLLALEIYEKMKNRQVFASLRTGEESIIHPWETHTSATVEMASLTTQYDVAVIDEIQMIGDPSRGGGWTRAVLGLQAKEIHLCGDASVERVIQELMKLTGDTVTIHRYERKTPLAALTEPLSIEQVQKGDALICFSRKKVLELAHRLDALKLSYSIIYGRLTPEVRIRQAEKFINGETDVIISTDAIGMGLNLPIKRVLFTQVHKTIDGQLFDLTPTEVKQIAGRAGRFGIHEKGEYGLLSLGEITKKQHGDLRFLARQFDEALQTDYAILTPSQLDYLQFKEEMSIVQYLQYFQHIKLTDIFLKADLTNVLEIAENIQDFDFSIKESFDFIFAPVNDVTRNYFYLMIRQYAKGYVRPPRIPAGHQLDLLEEGLLGVELFLYLRQRMSTHFDPVDLSAPRRQLIDKIDQVLYSKKNKKVNLK